MDIMLVEIFAKALLTCLVLFIAARHEADLSWHKVLMINGHTR